MKTIRLLALFTVDGVTTNICCITNFDNFQARCRAEDFSMDNLKLQLHTMFVSPEVEIFEEVLVPGPKVRTGSSSFERSHTPDRPNALANLQMCCMLEQPCFAMPSSNDRLSTLRDFGAFLLLLWDQEHR